MTDTALFYFFLKQKEEIVELKTIPFTSQAPSPDQNSEMKTRILSNPYPLPLQSWFSIKPQKKRVTSCREEVLTLSNPKPKDFDSFWNGAQMLHGSCETIRNRMLNSQIFQVHRSTLMIDTVKKYLDKRSDKTTFLDTVIFGLVFRSLVQ
jgi:hypothetical protein